MPFNDSIRIGASGAGGLQVARSLRFNSADNAYLERTVSTTSNRTTFTFSCWVKRTKITTSESLVLMGSNLTSGTSHTAISFDSNDTFALRARNPIGGDGATATTAVYRDPTAWMHVMYVVDTTQVGAQTVRQKVFVNGVEQTATVLTTHLVNSQLNINLINTRMAIGAVYYNGSNETDRGEFYLAEVNFVDGLALTPASFTQTDATTGQLIAKEYTGSYGTNGYRLTFSDNSSVSALGTDSSGNGNNFTANNFSVAAGPGNDSLEDTPTNNFPTLTPLAPFGSTTPSLSNGNLDFTLTSNNMYPMSTFLIPKSGKWYAEVVFTAGGNSQETVIVSNPVLQQNSSGASATHRHNAINYYNTDIRVDDSDVQTGLTAVGLNNVIGICVDRDAGTVLFKNNNSDVGSAVNLSAAAGSTEDLVFAVGRGSSSGNNISGHFNFGQRAFSYTPPTGFKALCSANLPDPTILKPNIYFETLLYTGNGSTQAITGLDFSPDWVWVKERSSTSSHALADTVRGPLKILQSDLTDAELTTTTNFVSFDSNGFTHGSGGRVNENGQTYAAWNWDAGATDGKTYTVTVVSSGGGNKFRFDGFAQDAVTLDLAEGGTYIFNYPSGHPFRFSTVADGTHGGGSEYTTGVTEVSTTQIKITVAASAPQLFYYCSIHSGMGGAINTNSTQGSSNFDGSTQSIVKVNPTAGFSIVSYTGSGSNATIGHGLGAAPQTYIIKERNPDATDWYVYHTGIGPTKQLKLNDPDDASTNARWQNTAPTSSVFYLNDGTASNGNNDTYIGYCFSEVAGYSKFGSYTGNGAANGTSVFLGFRPAFVFIKCDSANATSWRIFDNKRDSSNLVTQSVRADLNDTETNGVNAVLDFVANGFKLRGNSSSVNGSGSTYIFLAFAESPFKNSRAR